MGAGEADDVAGVLDGHALHAKADAEKGDLALASDADGADFTFDAALAEAAGDEDGVDVEECGFERFVGFAVDEFEVDPGPVGDAAVDEGFVEALVALGEVYVFADDADGDGGFGVFEDGDDFAPAVEVGARCPDIEQGADALVDLLFVEHEGHFVD